MEQLLFYNSKIVTLSLVFCAVLATFGVMMVVRQILTTSGTTLRHFFELRFRPAALRQTEKFEQVFGGYQDVAELLGRYSPDYSAVFNEAHWSNLTVTLDDLARAHAELCELLDRRESKDAMCLAEFLTSQGHELASWKYERISEEWEHLETWENDLYQIVCDVIQSLSEAVVHAQKLGISRGASAQETLSVLNLIRSQL